MINLYNPDIYDLEEGETPDYREGYDDRDLDEEIYYNIGIVFEEGDMTDD